MFAIRVKHDFLDDRLDAGFYRPDFLDMDTTLKARGAIKLEKLVRSVSCGPFGGNAIADDLYETEGIAFIRPVNISSNFFDDSSLVRVPEKNLLANGLKVYQGTNLYFGRVGNPCVAVISGETSISPNIIIVNTNVELADTHFLYAFSASQYGINQLLRQLKTVAQPTSSTDAIRQLLVFKPSDGVQKYIGDKVRQAERLSARAKLANKIPALIDAFILGYVPNSLISKLTEVSDEAAPNAVSLLGQILSLNIEEQPFTARLTELIKMNAMGSVDVDREQFHVNTVKISDIEDFLSAQTYRPAITAAYRAATLKKHTMLQHLCIEPIRQGATPHFSDKGKKCIKSKQTRDLFIEEEGYETVDPSHEKNQRIVRLMPSDVLVTRQGAGTVGRASIFLDDEETYITDSLFLLRVDSNKTNPGYVAGYLRSYTGQRLIEKGVYGSTGQLNLSSTALRNVPVVDIDVRLQNLLGEQVLIADKLVKLSKRLTDSAKFIVEALIEGQLNEDDLIAAENLLQTGNNELDRAILSRLKTDGVDGQGQPLFADLDQLYNLLEQASYS